MKTKKYIKPEITVIEIEGQQILAGSGGVGTDVSDNPADANLPTLSSSYNNVYDDEEEDNSYSIW